MNLKEVCQLFNAPYAGSQALEGVVIDSRLTRSGQLFIAIKGERLDGHDFVSMAVENGASAVIVEKYLPDIQVPQILVADTTQALATLARYHRDKMQCSLIALTGSNGKTTVKEMIAAILPQPSFASPGNFNNHIGVPLSVLKLEDKHRFAVFELGANHLHEITHVVSIVKPQVALVNNIGPAHIGEFGSIDKVAETKGEIYQGLAEEGIAIVNDDDLYAHFWDSLLTKNTVYRFSIQKPATFYAKNIVENDVGKASFTLVSPEGKTHIQLNVPGIHNISNALAATACTYALGIPLEIIAQGLKAFFGVGGRMTFLTGKNNSLVIDDTYNANLRSSLSALEVLSKRKGRRIFVFGDMAELGQWSQEHHAAIGAAAKQYGIELVMTCGKHSESTAKAYGDGKHYFSQNDLIEDLLHQLDANTTVLVKGSRSSAMEKIVHQLVS